jgi:hypothetical protein
VDSGSVIGRGVVIPPGSVIPPKTRLQSQDDANRWFNLRPRRFSGTG